MPRHTFTLLGNLQSILCDCPAAGSPHTATSDGNTALQITVATVEGKEGWHKMHAWSPGHSMTRSAMCPVHLAAAMAYRVQHACAQPEKF